jgi:hypothetical protein
MKRLLSAALLAGIALMPAASFGSSIIGVVKGQAYGNAWNPTVGGATSCSYGFSTNISSGSCTYISTGLINTAPFAGQTNSYTADVYSSVDLTTGSLHAFAGQSVANFPIDTQNGSGFGGSAAFDADAVALVADTLTFQAPGPTVPMQIVFKVSVDGVIKSFGADAAGGSAELDYGSGFNTQSTVFDNSSGGTIYTTPAQTVTSSTYNYFFTLTANSELDCGGGASNFTHLCTESGSADFSDTAQIVGIVLEDMSGNQLNGYTVSSQSGIDYDAFLAGDPNGVPEPATWALAGGALLVGLRMRRRHPRFLR